MATMPSATQAEAATPPYLPFSRFLHSLDALAGCMPARIDRSLWSGESPYLATVLVNAYAFLKLIEANGAPTARLHRLAADAARRADILRDVLQDAYGLGPATVEVEQVLSCFRVSGATHRKAVSFLVQACRYAGIPMSKELTAKMRLSHARTVSVPEERGMETTTVTVALESGGEITLSGRFNPFTLSADDRRFVFKLADELAAYRAKHREEAAPPEEDEVPF
jgi:hypothetical protein